MARVSVDLIDPLAPMVATRVREARRLPHLRYADVRLEVTEGKGAGAENGTPKYSGDDYGFALGVRVRKARKQGVGENPVLPELFGRRLVVRRRRHHRAPQGLRQMARRRELLQPAVR